MDELRELFVTHYGGPIPSPERAEVFRGTFTGMFAAWDSQTVGRLITNLIMMLASRGREDALEAGRALVAAAIAMDHIRGEKRKMN